MSPLLTIGAYYNVCTVIQLSIVIPHCAGVYSALRPTVMTGINIYCTHVAYAICLTYLIDKMNSNVINDSLS